MCNTTTMMNSFGTIDCDKSIPCAALLSSQDQSEYNCPQQAKYTCGVCSLVAYCSKECQSRHWTKHKKDCKQSSLAAKTWQPRWCSEDRQPAFISDGPAMDVFNAPGYADMTKYLWGNTPAIDLLKLDNNEGTSYDGSLKVCYAASGDIRNAMRTIVDLSPIYKGTVEILLNDREIYVAMRNILFVLLLTVPNKSAAVDAIIHFWFSAMLTTKHIDMLRSTVVPFFQDVCGKIVGKDANSMQFKKFQINKGTLKVSLTPLQWRWILKFLTRSIDSQTALQSCREVCLSRPDHRERHLCCFNTGLHRRVAKVHFREQGILLPFGRSSAAFDQPNPTLFNDCDQWVLDDISDPLDGFGKADIINYARGVQGELIPGNDVYGQLYCYLRSQVSTMYNRVREGINIEVSAQDATAIGSIYKDRGGFDRIDTSNIVDLPYLGVSTTLAALKPLLNTTNSHASIVSHFMNAVSEEDHFTGQVQTYRAVSLATSWLASPSSPLPMDLSSVNPLVTKVIMATNFFIDREALWKSYLSHWKMLESAAAIGMKPRQNHRIIAQWPYGLTKRRQDPGAQEELEQLMTSGESGLERYVEWVPL